MELWNQIAQWTGWPVLVAIFLILGTHGYFVLKTQIDSLKEDNNRLARELGRRESGKFPVKHYVLFWRESSREWAHDDWNNAYELISKFGLTCGFRAEEAANAEQVTIIGSSRGIDNGVESFLKRMGCHVQRLDGRTSEDTALLLKQMVESETSFTEGVQRHGY